VIQDLKRKLTRFGEELETFRGGQKVLERQRYAFPDEWLQMDTVDGEWDAFTEILARKDQAIQGQVSTLQLKIVDEDRALERRITELLSDWERHKPVGGDTNPDQATTTLSLYETRFLRAMEDVDGLRKAKSALDLDVRDEERLQPRLEELRDLKSSWSELSRIWASITDLKVNPRGVFFVVFWFVFVHPILKKLPFGVAVVGWQAMSWSAVVPRQLRGKLDDLIAQLKNLPARVRSYASYEYTMTSVTEYLKANAHVTNLKSDALKERHWRALMKSIGVNWVLLDLTLGEVWQVDFARHASHVHDVMVLATGEMALEEYLKQVREDWTVYELDLVNYQNKTKLIRGWDDLFSKCKEHLNSLSAMKASPYFKAFEEETLAWDDKLNRIAALFDVWMDVQRRWVYLEGIFTGSEEIKHLLPGETSRFQSIASEFVALMKKVSKNPLVLEVINIPSAQRALERLAELLAKIQKALGEYLEKERSQFPRFYFVGDEDLLEIIGNSKDAEKIQKHFRKMFAGLHSLLLNDEHADALGFSSKEGEDVVFKTPVKIKGEKINVWLTNIESEMRVTLAKLLAEAVKNLAGFALGGPGAKFPLEAYLAWLDQFQAQLVVVAVQIAWTTAVDAALQQGGAVALQNVLAQVEGTLNALADTVLLYQPPIRRKKLEHLITEMVHQRDVTRELMQHGVTSPKDFAWLAQMRFYFNPKTENVLQQLTIKLANADFHYGFEYLGLAEKLVQTPLTDRAYMTLTQALKARQGGGLFPLYFLWVFLFVC
jgi:dynein heavy chain 1